MNNRVVFSSLFLLSLVISCGQPAKKPDTTDIETVQNILAEQIDAWNRGDIDGFMQGYWRSDNLRFSGRTGTMHGYETLRSSYQKSFPNRDDMGRLTFQVDTIYQDRIPYLQVEGAWTIHRYDTVQGRFILTFQEIEKDTWKIVEDHTW
ncbi:nuclear transport factor 2 family protein [bacterium]|nr:nuclear transport factor 2 family protein [bacterium]